MEVDSERSLSPIHILAGAPSLDIRFVPPENTRLQPHNQHSETYTGEDEGSQAAGAVNAIHHSNSDRTTESEDSCEHVPDVEQEPPAKQRKLNVSIQDDGATCPICLDTWGNSGSHRLVSLRCGHLFGASCVERWLNAQAARERSCPTCKSRASMKDIRSIYTNRLIAADASQITALQKQIDILQTEKMQCELELEKSRIAHRACMLQLEDLRKTLLKNQVKEQPQQRRSWRFALEKNLELNRDGGCRVLTYNCRTNELYVSQKSTNNLFPGFGVRKVNCFDFKLGQFVFLHNKPIRDITYSRPRDLLLSVGLDTTAKIVERGILRHMIPCGMPLWSCSWDYLRTNEFYVGGNGGEIQHHDIRNPGPCIEKLKTDDCSPIIALASTEHGLLSCQINSSWLWVPNTGPWKQKRLPLTGPFMSMAYDNDSHKVLLSCRASATERSRLSLCKVKSVNSEVIVEYEKTFPGSTRTNLMCKSAFVKAPGATWIAAHSESDATLYLHGLDASRMVSLPASEPALDVCATQGEQGMVLAAVSDCRLRLYKAVPVT